MGSNYTLPEIVALLRANNCIPFIFRVSDRKVEFMVLATKSVIGHENITDQENGIVGNIYYPNDGINAIAL